MKTKNKFLPDNSILFPWKEENNRLWSFSANISCKACLWTKECTNKNIRVKLERKVAHIINTHIYYALTIDVSRPKDNKRTFTFPNQTPSKAKREADKKLKELGFFFADENKKVML